MENVTSHRTGTIIRQISGYDAFIPHKLTETDLDLQLDRNMIQLLSEADRSLGELIGMTKTIPDPDLFIAFYVRKEALLSSQIEGTQCSLDEVIQVDENEADMKPVHEVVNYINAMNEGLQQLKNVPMSLRLMNQIHRVLLADVRGAERQPGELKHSQNWIGPPGCMLNEAVFVPPPPDRMNDLMGDWENYYHQKRRLPALIEAAVLHAHFETIHPYIDGNGRLGRLLITFMLCEREVMPEPLLYLSLFFKEHRSEYYQLLMDVRFKGAWEEWIKFFLRGVQHTSKEAVKTALDIRLLAGRHRKMINEKLSRYSTAIPCFDILCRQPIISIVKIRNALNCSYPAAKNIIDALINLDIVHPYEKKRKRNKLYVYSDYLNILKRGT
jgi:Fic family protein